MKGLDYIIINWVNVKVKCFIYYYLKILFVVKNLGLEFD